MSTIVARRRWIVVTLFRATALACAALPPAAQAAECSLPRDLDAMSAAIRKSESCVAAAQLAEDCAFGASGDVALQGSVITVCEKDFAASLTQQARGTYNRARESCRRKYEKMQGTMYVSASAMCEGAVAQHYSTRALKARAQGRS